MESENMDFGLLGRGLSNELLQYLCSLRWKKRFNSTLAIYGRHAGVFAVGASEATACLCGIRVAKSTFTAWPLCSSNAKPVIVVFRYDALTRCDGYFVEELDTFLDWVDLPYFTIGQREYTFVAHATPRLKPEAVESGEEIWPGVKTSYSLRVLEGLPRQ